MLVNAYVYQLTLQGGKEKPWFVDYVNSRGVASYYHHICFQAASVVAPNVELRRDMQVAPRYTVFLPHRCNRLNNLKSMDNHKR